LERREELRGVVVHNNVAYIYQRHCVWWRSGKHGGRLNPVAPCRARARMKLDQI
jgi:hypothetical protein